MPLENELPPVPSLVLVVRAIVGLEEVLQQTPLAITDAAQLPVIFPPEDAVVEVIPDIAVVKIDGTTVPAVNVRSAP
jgi:hypothetical protein